jgi:hypothetical protein
MSCFFLRGKIIAKAFRHASAVRKVFMIGSAVAKRRHFQGGFCGRTTGTAGACSRFEYGITLESIMKAKEGWRRHLRELVGASLDPMVYAVQWARDPRCLRHGSRHRRVGAFESVHAPACRLWSAASKPGWE